MIKEAFMSFFCSIYYCQACGNIKIVLFFVAAQPKVVLHSSEFQTSPDVAVINNQLMAKSGNLCLDLSNVALFYVVYNLHGNAIRKQIILIFLLYITINYSSS